MSREVLGLGDDELYDVPTRAIQLRGSSAATDITTDPAGPPGAVTPIGDGPPSRLPQLRRSRWAAMVAVTAAVGAAAGWAGTAGAAMPSPPVDVAVWASLSTIDEDGANGAMAARIRVVNDGRERVTITVSRGADGVPRASRAALTAAVQPATLNVPAGQSAELTAVLRVDCASPLGLDLDPVLATRADGTTQPIPVQGAASELMRVCAARAGVLQLHMVDKDDGRLRVGLTVPGGRSLRVVAITAGGLELSGRPFPAQVDGQVRSVWLNPPASCPPSWQTRGAPRVLTVIAEDPYDQGSGSTQARLDLLVGDMLATWLLDAGCPSGA